jgi:hypothetical protein
MASLGESAALILVLGFVCTSIAVFSAIGALCARVRHGDVRIGALYGAIFGPLGALASALLPRRLLGQAPRTTGGSTLQSRGHVSSPTDDLYE